MKAKMTNNELNVRFKSVQKSNKPNKNQSLIFGRNGKIPVLFLCVACTAHRVGKETGMNWIFVL